MTDSHEEKPKNYNSLMYTTVGLVIIAAFTGGSIVFATMHHIIFPNDAVSISLYSQTSMTIIWNLAKILYPPTSKWYSLFNYLCGGILILSAIWSFILVFYVLAPSGWQGACKIAFIPTVTLAIGFLQPLYTTHSFKCERTRQIFKCILVVFYILSFILAFIAS